MATALELNGCKCLNPNHRTDAEAILHRPVRDHHTMNVFYDKTNEKVTLKCYWCDYEAEVDVAVRPLQVTQYIGGETTLGPPAT